MRKVGRKCLQGLGSTWKVAQFRGKWDEYSALVINL